MTPPLLPETVCGKETPESQPVAAQNPPPKPTRAVPAKRARSGEKKGATARSSPCPAWVTPPVADATPSPVEPMEARRERQRAVCLRLLERWVPVAASAELAVRHEGKAGPVVDEEPLETGLKAGAFVLKVLERLARLDGVDNPEGTGLSIPAEPLLEDPVELARRVQTVTPILLARLARGDAG